MNQLDGSCPDSPFGIHMWAEIQTVKRITYIIEGQPDHVGVWPTTVMTHCNLCGKVAPDTRRWWEKPA